MYHIEKDTRIYCGVPYCGYSSGGEMMQFDTLEEAREAKERLEIANSGVGWNIWNAETKEIVDGVDQFEGM
jgi:hypothetical protein